jgi:hypothetical protein
MTSLCVAKCPGLPQHAQQVGIIVYVGDRGLSSESIHNTPGLSAPPPQLKPTTVEVRMQGVLDERLQLRELALFHNVEK